jgi:two-component system, cell cycle sensor histidine kinase and response regulator CckA
MESNDDASGSISPLHLTVRAAVRLAHNLRNLLMIMGRCIDEIRAELPSNSPVEKDLTELDRGIDQALHLTGQLLAIGRPTPRERVVVDLNRLVVGAEGMIARALERNITRDIRLTAQRPRVLGDPYELEWILLNLLINSREAMPAGGRVTIETADHNRVEHGNGVPVVRLTVTDASQGPPSEPQDHAPPREYDTSEIAAIRLGNVAILVENLGGWLVIEYETGHGTTIHVDLPAV